MYIYFLSSLADSEHSLLFYSSINSLCIRDYCDEEVNNLYWWILQSNQCLLRNYCFVEHHWEIINAIRVFGQIMFFALLDHGYDQIINHVENQHDISAITLGEKKLQEQITAICWKLSSISCSSIYNKHFRFSATIICQYFELNWSWK